MSMRNRPTIFDADIQSEVAQQLLPSLIKWLQARGEEICDEEEKKHVTEEVAKAIDTAVSYDSYKIARELDDAGWFADGDLVSLLERALSFAIGCHDRKTRKWVQDEGIVAGIAVGTTVRVYDRGGRLIVYEGTIIRVDPSKARYLIFSEKLGHVQQGQGSHGRWEACELVEPVEPANEETVGASDG